ncbi:hypothetical protein SAMD00019534_017860, partial [Acytostelium subglobosum LB1]|uniref:hypothetical protein n=1 Tax=Acytostelium subglobosum LB1 TaxID=1410327 RepID=UPI0006451E76
LMLGLLLMVALLHASGGSVANAADCKSALSKYFNGDQMVQMTAVMSNGQVFYTVQKLYLFYTFLTNGNPFYVVESTKEACINGHLNPFDIHNQTISFFDRSGIVIQPTGEVTLSPLWKPAGDTFYKFNLNCDQNVLYGNDQGSMFTFVFLDSSVKA